MIWPHFTHFPPVFCHGATAPQQDPEDRPDAELLLDILGSFSSAEAPPVLPLPPGFRTLGREGDGVEVGG